MVRADKTNATRSLRDISMANSFPDTTPITVTVNGRPLRAFVEAKTLLVQLLRDEFALTGTHIGCDTSQCGSCVVLLNGESVKSCTVLALQADGAEILTIEGLASGDVLHPLQEAFQEHHGLQCGFCTPGMILSALDLLKHHPNPTEAEILAGLEGNFCRCTGYAAIVKAIKAGAAKMRETAS